MKIDALGLQKLGVGMAALMIISRYITVNATFTSSEATITYGLLAGMLFGILGALAFWCIGFVVQNVKEHNPKVHSFEELLKRRLNGRSLSLIKSVIAILCVADLFILALGGGTVLYALFFIPIPLGILSFLVVSLPIYLFNKRKGVAKYNIYKTGIFFAVVIMALVYLFLITDLKDMFHGMRLFHPYLFVIQVKELLLFLFGIFIVFFARLFVDPLTWDIVFRIKQKKANQSLVLSGVIWGTIPFAFSTLIYAAIYEGGFQNISTIFYDLFRLFNSQIFTLILGGVLLLAFLLTFTMSLRSFLRFYGSRKEEEAQMVSPFQLIVLCLIVLLIFYINAQPSFLDLFFFFGIAYVSLLFPLVGLFITKASPLLLVSSACISIAIGYINLFYTNYLLSILVAAITSLILSVFIFVNNQSD